MLAAGGLMVVGLVVAGVGASVAWRSFAKARDVGRHVPRAPVTPLAAARPGERIHALGEVTSQDVLSSPTGAPPAAYFAVDLDRIAVGNPSLRRFRVGTELWMRDASGATSLVQMEHAEVLDRAAVEWVWLPVETPPRPVQPFLAAHQIVIPRPIRGVGVDVRYRERALRRGDPMRVSGLVLAVDRDESGAPRVVLGTDRRVPLHVSNATDADLAALQGRHRRWIAFGVALTALGLVMTVTGIALGSALSR